MNKMDSCLIHKLKERLLQATGKGCRYETQPKDVKCYIDDIVAAVDDVLGHRISPDWEECTRLGWRKGDRIRVEVRENAEEFIATEDSSGVNNFPYGATVYRTRQTPKTILWPKWAEPGDVFVIQWQDEDGEIHSDFAGAIQGEAGFGFAPLNRDHEAFWEMEHKNPASGVSLLFVQQVASNSLRLEVLHGFNSTIRRLGLEHDVHP